MMTRTGCIDGTAATAREIRRALIGRKIVGVKLRPFPTGRGPGDRATDPIIILNDGTWIGFSTQETEVGEYGTSLNVFPREGK